MSKSFIEEKVEELLNIENGLLLGHEDERTVLTQALQDAYTAGGREERKRIMDIYNSVSPAQFDLFINKEYEG